MTGPGPDWVSLRDFIEAVLDERRSALDAILAERDHRLEDRYRGQEQALILAREEMERRLEGLNELRQQVVEDRGRFVTRELFDSAVAARDTELDEIKEFQGKILGLMAATAIIAGIVGAAVSAIVAHLIG